jgi:hypothetical protein
MLYLLAEDHFVVKEMPIHSNWASQERYREIGLWLKEHCKGRGIAVQNEIGTIAYYSDCYPLNYFADRWWLKSYLKTIPPGLKSWLAAVNYCFLGEVPNPLPYSLFLVEDERNASRYTACPRWKISSRWFPHGLLVLMPIGKLPAPSGK